MACTNRDSSLRDLSITTFDWKQLVQDSLVNILTSSLFWTQCIGQRIIYIHDFFFVLEFEFLRFFLEDTLRLTQITKIGNRNTPLRTARISGLKS